MIPLQPSLLPIIALVLTMSVRASGQGTFQNLDFESATLVPIPGDPYGRVEFAAAFPGWTGYIGTDVLTVADHNNRSLSEPGIAIMGPDYPSAGLFQGHFYAQLYLVSPAPPVLVELAQVGTIPMSAQSIRFYGGDQDPPFVEFSGQQIALSVLATTSTYTLYGGDISVFAGQQGRLSFKGSRLLDNIQFSTEAIPEPNSVGLLGVAALLLGWRFRRKSKLWASPGLMDTLGSVR